MVKINFNTPFPHSQRDVFIHAFRDLGFKYERIFQSGEYSLFKFFGTLPLSDSKTNIDILVSSDTDIDVFKQLLVKNVEIFVMFERS